ncbi:MAG TPA: recombinase family protein [Terracidiphilus sp.]|nr:recombinase family protein [Terracidiphilus sp.]
MTIENHCLSSHESVRCAIYARTGALTAREDSAIEQIQRCKEAAQKKGWTVIEDFIRIDHGGSGISMQDRTGLQELITLTATEPRPFDYVICVSTDRLTRNMGIAGQIVDTFTHHGVNLYFVSNGLDSADPTFRVILNCVAEPDLVYSKCLGDRIRRGKMGRFLSGYHPGARCFGYTNVPEKVSDPQSEHGRIRVIGVKQTKCDSEAKVVERIFEGYASGLGLKAIATQLNADGVPPPQGRAAGTPNWSSSAIATILGNERYVGRTRWNKRCVTRNPATGRREEKLRPESAWLTLEKPELRIISDDMFTQVKEQRQRANGPAGRG